MPLPNENQNPVSDEQKDNARFEELNKVPETERNDEQKKELGDLKERYGKRMQKKIDTMTAKQRTLEEENERIKAELDEVKAKPPVKDEPALKEEFVEIAGKKYFTDQALMSQVKSGEITEDEAYSYQRKRDKEEIKEDLRKERDVEDKRSEDVKLRKEDSDTVLKNYPHFNKKHPDFNSEDPLYKLSNELYTEAYAVNPRGLSLAIKRAKEILRISDQHIDRSEDFEVEGSEPSERQRREKEVTLSEGEKEAAVRMYTRGDVINPKTNRPYTANEALTKALNAKKARTR